MFSVVRRAQNHPGSQLPTLSEWDPVQLMENLLRLDPFGELNPTRRAGAGDSTFTPRFDVKETKDEFVFKADLPGVKEEDIEISVTGNRLSISGKRSAEEQKQGENYYMVERAYGSFSRSFTLPESADTDRITASTDNGVLWLNIPKRVESQPRRVTLTKGQSGYGTTPQTPGKKPVA